MLNSTLSTWRKLLLSSLCYWTFWLSDEKSLTVLRRLSFEFLGFSSLETLPCVTIPLTIWLPTIHESWIWGLTHSKYNDPFTCFLRLQHQSGKDPIIAVADRGHLSFTGVPSPAPNWAHLSTGPASLSYITNRIPALFNLGCLIGGFPLLPFFPM